MIAYEPLSLKNLYIRKQAEAAFQQGYLDKEETALITSKYPVNFYSPNLFIRIGLFILTTVILLFSFGLFVLLFLSSIDHAIGGMAIFFALISYAALEYMVQTRMHFQSGVDDALLWISGCCLFGGISFLTGAGDLTNCIIIFIISLYCTLRFADRVMSIVLFISLLGTFLFAFARMPIGIRSLFPFFIMVFSAAIYLLMARTKHVKTNWLYSGYLQINTVLALLCFYFAGNYYTVAELNHALINTDPGEKASIAVGWLFWIFTMAVPCLYLARGIQKKIILIRVGLLLIAAAIYTKHFYYPVAAVEVIMTAGGIILVIVSYGLTRYLGTPKFGFTNQEVFSTSNAGKSAIEPVALAQTFKGESEVREGAKFGGGSFGGGGATGEF